MHLEGSNKIRSYDKLPTVRGPGSANKLEYLFDKIKLVFSHRTVLKNLSAGSFLFTIQIILLNKSIKKDLLDRKSVV